MTRNRLLFATILIALLAQETVRSQDLLKLVDSTPKKKEYVTRAFKSTRVIMGQSMEMLGKGVMDVRILHRFGYVNSGIYDFFGWDQGAQMRFGFDFGLSNNFMIGVGRTSLDKEYDVLAKWRPVQQATGPGASPFSILWTADFTVNTSKSDQYFIFPNNIPAFTRVASGGDTTNVANTYGFSERWSLYSGVIIGRKFSEKFTAQLTPEVVLHHNYALRPSSVLDVNYAGTRPEVGNNTIVALGIGARYRLSKHFAFVVDYHHIFSGLADGDGIDYQDPLSVGFDIETGGHVFQLHFSNAIGMTERSVLGATTDKWSKGDFRFGFNLSRVFTIGGKSKNQSGAKKY